MWRYENSSWKTIVGGQVANWKDISYAPLLGYFVIGAKRFGTEFKGVVTKSTDYGVTWGNPTEMGFFGQSMAWSTDINSPLAVVVGLSQGATVLCIRVQME
jgi:hypothetical protein